MAFLRKNKFLIITTSSNFIIRFSFCRRKSTIIIGIRVGQYERNDEDDGLTVSKYDGIDVLTRGDHPPPGFNEKVQTGLASE